MESNSVSEKIMLWGQLHPSHQWCTSGSNADGQKQRDAEEHHLVRKCKIVSALEDLEMPSTEGAICKSLLSHF